jgi:hypothetical protein
MTSPPLPLLPVARLPTTPAKLSMLAENLDSQFRGRRLQSLEVVFLSSKPFATSCLSALLTYTSIRLDADGTSRRLIWRLPVRLSNWEY